MTLKITPLCQRDSRWRNLLLGFNIQSEYSIGNYGCLLTCLSMLVGVTPDILNQRIKDVGGFTQGGLFIWGKSTELGLTSIYTSPKWGGPVTDFGVTQAKQYLDRGCPLVAEIDFNPATVGEEMHFVLVIGYEGDNFIMADPWTGNISTMDPYGGFVRSVIQFHVYDKTFPVTETTPDLQEELNEVRKARDDHWNDLMKIKEALIVPGEYAVDVILRRCDMLIGVERDSGKKDTQIKEMTERIKTLESQIEDQRQQIEKATETVKTLQPLVETVESLKRANKGLSDSLQELKQASQPVLFTGWKKTIYDWLRG